MRMTDGRTGMEILSRDQCNELLQTQRIGRLAVVVNHEPQIFPVNYAMDGENILLRTAEGTKLDAAVRTTRVAFEIDGTDDGSSSGWSVVVRGRVDEVLRTSERERLSGLELQPWAEGPKDNWLLIRPERVTGRRVLPRSE